MAVQKSFEAHNLKIVGFDSHTRYKVSFNFIFMYASKRSIGKQGVWGGAPADNAKGIKEHGNRGNKRGNKFYVQTITKKGAASDANETLTKTIVHYTGHDMFNIHRPRKQKPGYLKNSKKHRAA